MTDRFGLNKATVQTHNGSFMDMKTASNQPFKTLKYLYATYCKNFF